MCARVYIYLSISLSMYIYVYIYIYTYVMGLYMGDEDRTQEPRDAPRAPRLYASARGVCTPVYPFSDVHACILEITRAHTVLITITVIIIIIITCHITWPHLLAALRTPALSSADPSPSFIPCARSLSSTTTATCG